MVWAIIIGIIVLLYIISFLRLHSENKTQTNYNINNGGYRDYFKLFTKQLESSYGMKLSSDTGNMFLYKTDVIYNGYIRGEIGVRVKKEAYNEILTVELTLNNGQIIEGGRIAGWYSESKTFAEFEEHLKNSLDKIPSFYRVEWLLKPKTQYKLLEQNAVNSKCFSKKDMFNYDPKELLPLASTKNNISEKLYAISKNSSNLFLGDLTNEFHKYEALIFSTVMTLMICNEKAISLNREIHRAIGNCLITEFSKSSSVLERLNIIDEPDFIYNRMKLYTEELVKLYSIKNYGCSMLIAKLFANPLSKTDYQEFTIKSNPIRYIEYFGLFASASSKYRDIIEVQIDLFILNNTSYVPNTNRPNTR